ncbi:hypothetical protein BC938DRAFT_473004, partial [Jimgerdemannia flammicorona]
VIVHKSKERGGRSSITAASYSLDGKWIAGGEFDGFVIRRGMWLFDRAEEVGTVDRGVASRACQDGTFNLWPATGPYLRPSHSIEKAHVSGTETSSILWSVNHQTVVTRGGDDTVKVWDVRNFKAPVRVANELPINNPETNVVFSPDERLIVTGTAVKKGEGYGKLVMMDRETLEIKRTMSIFIEPILYRSRA